MSPRGQPARQGRPGWAARSCQHSFQPYQARTWMCWPQWEHAPTMAGRCRAGRVRGCGGRPAQRGLAPGCAGRSGSMPKLTTEICRAGRVRGCGGSLSAWTRTWLCWPQWEHALVNRNMSCRARVRLRRRPAQRGLAPGCAGRSGSMPKLTTEICRAGRVRGCGGSLSAWTRTWLCWPQWEHALVNNRNMSCRARVRLRRRPAQRGLAPGCAGRSGSMPPVIADRCCAGRV